MNIIRASSTATQSAIAMKDTPDSLQGKTISISTQALRNAIEHLPSVNNQRLRTEKYATMGILVPLNFTLLYMFKSYLKYFWGLAPLVIMRSLVDFIEITLVIIFFWYRRLYPQVLEVPKTPESFVYLLCCYNETYMELMVSLNSLAMQNSIDEHKKLIIVVCDGHVSTKGNAKTAAAYLKEDIIERPSSTFVPEAYTSWDGNQMDVELIKGEFKGFPIICLIKNENRGKRDGIVLIRSFLHKFNSRKLSPSLAMLTPKLFDKLSLFLESNQIQSVDYAIGIDADTRFDPECVSNLLQTVREGDKVVGVTGYIRADPQTSSPISLSYLYQNAEYTVGQHRRRLRQSLTNGRVTCLPGCCQLLRVQESTCGDHILGRFGYYPKETDGLFRTIRSMMSEDRDHVCLVLSEYSDVQTRLCLKAKAYTTAPWSPSIFLSQRRRWTLGPLTSDSLLISRKSTGYMERIAALCSVFHWVVNPALYISKYYRILDNRTLSILYFLENYRKVWDLMCVIFSARSLLESLQLLSGIIIYGLCAPFVNFVVQLYTIYNLDDFRWGKTRIASLGTTPTYNINTS
ncbi:glycosyltransferase family 2 protein [Bipolaris maydis ATCC 48331]|uniref:chitin synthase n=2 Tax=Cochliobolus heterostrophus TaxID=5016 RepID=M2SJI5_COCH5|nr:glycosyltransferase family 2 protein [Bipolaris maydis ATCC 48331]EMD85490.1 glycosyltransferase family 2 protein [Bipolaris maydis C5]KAJ5021257.1 glycosyltransferase [Bipolaris maydis]ENH98688.1 glycosyltransferase family 2 protein [Bipolaris maydis ATCC 48331]KAJ5055453.1 chitin synthase [Bipolaris maydis]KAJ6193171.1 chitin synthase [Bipolaris maydis]